MPAAEKSNWSSRPYWRRTEFGALVFERDKTKLAKASYMLILNKIRMSE